MSIPNPFEYFDARLDLIESLLVKLNNSGKNKSALDADEDSILDINEAAAYIKLSIPSIYRLTGENALPVIKKGKKLLFSKKALTAWLMEGSRKTLKDIEKDALKES